MNFRAILCSAVGTVLVVQLALLAQEQQEATVTQIFHDVQVLPAEASPRPATINDKVSDNTGLRTGADSRSELTYPDLTITRLGANTIFSFNKAERKVQLDGGSILVYMPKNSGGAQISTKAVSVAITGTTLIIESEPSSYDRLLVLEGTARLSLNNFPNQSREVRRGQMLNVNAGAKKIPKPGRIDLRRIVKTHPLITNFPPLPSLDLILPTAPAGNSPAPRPIGSGGVPPSYFPNPTGPTPVGGYPPRPVPTPRITPVRPLPPPTATIKPTPRPTPRRSPTPGRPGLSPKPSARPTLTPKRRFPPPKKVPTTTPTPTQIIR